MSSNFRATWPGWETVRLIGRGSFGAVYEIQRKLFEDDEEVEKAALKVISIPQNDSDIEEMYNDGYDEESVTSTFRSHLKSIVAEYSLMRKMNGSANIVNCDDVRYEHHADGIGWDIYIKMELLTPLAKSLPANVSDAQVVAVAKDMCAALELCDRYNIVHRDIKPQNIFVSPNGDYKLGDFGIAKTVEKTMGGTKTGTYKYMAPEVYNNKPYNSTADIYSLGLVLYWMLNERRMPFMPLPPAKLSAGMDEASRARRFSGEPIPTPKNGSEELKQIVLKACAFAPKDRYQSAREMLEDLQRISGGAVPTPVVKPKQNSPAAQQTELPEEATVGPVFSRKAAPVVDDQDETVGPVFGGHAAVAAEAHEKTVGPQFAAKKEEKVEQKPEKKLVKKNQFGLIAAAVLLLIGLCVVLIPTGTANTPAETTPLVVQQHATVTKEETASNLQYTLMSDVPESDTNENLPLASVFGSKYQRKQIYSISFLSNTKGAPADSWDVSQEQDSTVLAWVKPNGDLYDLYIGAKGGILAPENCKKLFAGYVNLQQISFDDQFITTNVTDMYGMFMFCRSLTSLNVSGFDTGKVTDMGGMFYNCTNLAQLDVSGFDTAEVTSMRAMFSGCAELRVLDVSGFDTAMVSDMSSMFFGCIWLHAADTSGFDTANVKNMSYMFYHCYRLKDVFVSGFDISNVENYKNFLDENRSIQGRPWEEFFTKK